jgi:glucan biosynthesis protein C
VLLDPLTDYLGALAEGKHPRLWPYLADQTGTRDTGPMWFVALLGLTALAAWALATDRFDAVAGGLTWPSAAFAVLEGVGAVALSLWLVAWFRRRWDRPGPLVRRAGRGSYAAYVLHPPVLVALSLLARPLPVVPEAKFVLVAVSGVTAAFTAGVGLIRLRAGARLL